METPEIEPELNRFYKWMVDYSIIEKGIDRAIYVWILSIITFIVSEGFLVYIYHPESEPVGYLLDWYSKHIVIFMITSSVPTIYVLMDLFSNAINEKILLRV